MSPNLYESGPERDAEAQFIRRLLSMSTAAFEAKLREGFHPHDALAHAVGPLDAYFDAEG